MVIDYPDDPDVPWTSFNQVISLGSPSGTSLQSMTIALAVVIDHIYYTEEQIELNVARLTLSNEQSLSFSQSVSDNL